MELVNRAYVYSCMSSDCVLFELITLVWAVNFWRILENLYSIVTNGFDRLFVLMNGVYVLMCSAGISVRTEFHTGKSKYWTSLSEVRVNSLGHTTGYEFINQNEPNLKDVPHCLISASTSATVFCARNLCESVIVYFWSVAKCNRRRCMKLHATLREIFGFCVKPGELFVWFTMFFYMLVKEVFS